MPALLLTFVFIAIGWFLIIRPQQQRMREQRELVDSLAPGDRVITAGGIHGELVSVDEETVELRVADGIVLTLARPAIARLVDPSEAATDDGPIDDGPIDGGEPS